MKENTVREQILSLIQGKTKASTEIVSFMVDKMTNLQIHHVPTEGNIQQGQRQVESFQYRLIAIKAQQEKYAEDLEFWIQKEKDATESKPEAIDDAYDKVAIAVGEKMRKLIDEDTDDEQPKPEEEDKLKSESESEYQKARDQYYATKENPKPEPEDTDDGYGTADDRPPARNDQHRNERSRTPKEVAHGVRASVAGVQRERPSGGPSVAGGGASTSGDNLGVSGPPEDHCDWEVRDTETR